MGDSGSEGPVWRLRLPNPRQPLPPPVSPPPDPDAHAAPPGGWRRVPLGSPMPNHPARRPPPAALLLLCGSGVFLFLAIAAAVIGAAAGSSDITSTPARPGTSPASSPPARHHDYGTPEANAIYRTGAMASVHCDAVVTSSEPVPYERFVRKTTACLDRAWRAQLAQRGIDFTAPGLVISRSETPTSPCRSGDSGYLPIAFYCPANQTVYYSLQSASRVSVLRNRAYLVSSPAHEYGHHVQQLVGISAAYDTRYGKAYPDDVARYTKLTRRLELQAQCFAGVFVGSNATTMRVSRTRMAATAGRTGDDAVTGAADDPRLRTHGSFANNRAWLVAHGWDGRSPGDCNTWTAPDPSVG